MEVSGYQSGRRKEKGQRAEDGRRAIFCRLLHSFFCILLLFCNLRYRHTPIPLSAYGPFSVIGIRAGRPAGAPRHPPTPLPTLLEKRYFPFSVIGIRARRPTPPHQRPPPPPVPPSLAIDRWRARGANRRRAQICSGNRPACSAISHYLSFSVFNINGNGNGSWQPLATMILKITADMFPIK